MNNDEETIYAEGYHDGMKQERENTRSNSALGDVYNRKEHYKKILRETEAELLEMRRQRDDWAMKYTNMRNSLAPLPVQNSVAVVERDNGGEIGTFFQVPIESLEGRSLYLSPFDTPGYVLVPVGPSVPPEMPEPVAEAIVIHDIDGDEVITFNIIHPELIKGGTQLYISRGVK